MTIETIRESIRAEVRERAREAEMMLDDAQLALLDELSAFAAAMFAAPEEGDVIVAAEPPVGWFVHGPAGRGKTWLLQAVFDAVPVELERKRRVHFHTFFHDLQQRFGVHGSTRAAIDATVTELLDGAAWFLFDELHVHDPAGASLLNHLLAGIVERGTPTLITSNYAPDDLLPQHAYHHVFEPGIALLRTRFEVRSIDGGVDYRRQRRARTEGFAAGRWMVAADDEALRFAGWERPGADERTELASGSYRFPARAVRDGESGREVWFDFVELLESSTTAQDFVRWASEFDRWVLLDVPPLSATSREAHQRLVWLIDVLADADRPLTVIAAVPRDRFVDVETVPPDLFRTSSRLALLAD